MRRHHAQAWRVRISLAVACAALLGASATMQESPFPRGIGPLPDVRGFQGMNDPRLPDVLKQGVVVRPLEGFGAPGAIRVSIGTAEENAFFSDALGHVLSGVSS